MTKNSIKVIFTKTGYVDDIDVHWRRIIWYKKSPKYFIGYNDDDVSRLLCIKLSQIIGYVK